MMQNYGDVYFKAWRAAEGPTLQRIGLFPAFLSQLSENRSACLEYNCMQDLVHHAAHASTKNLASGLRSILNWYCER